MPEVDQEELALEKRRYVYRHNLYVKHVASNRFTRVSWEYSVVVAPLDHAQLTHEWNPLLAVP